MGILPAAAKAVVILSQHPAGEVLLLGIEPAASGEQAGRLPGVLRRGGDPALRLHQGRHQRAGGVRVAFHPVATGAQHLFRMLGPDILGSGRGEADTVVNGAGVPWLADAKAAHIADAHVHHHLRRRHHDGAHIVEGIDAGARQPVVKPHGMGAGRKGMREGVTARRAAVDQPLQPAEVGHPFLLQLAGEGNRLAIAVEGHQIGHRLRLAGDPQFEAVQQAIENMRRVELAGHQLVAHRRPAGFLTRHQGDAIFLVKPLRRGDGQRRAIGQRNKSDPHAGLLRFVRAAGPGGLHHARQQHRAAQRGPCLQQAPPGN